MRKAITLVAVSAALAGCTTTSEVPDSRLATADIRYANGLPAGTAQIVGTATGATVIIALAGAPEGVHGVHLHLTGQCGAPDFKSAGGHLNPANRQHGTDNPAGSHMGDMPNITVNGSGTGSLRYNLAGTRVQLVAALFDADGTALVAHAGPDDYRTDPSGNSGARIACGVLQQL